MLKCMTSSLGSSSQPSKQKQEKSDDKQQRDASGQKQGAAAPPLKLLEQYGNQEMGPQAVQVNSQQNASKNRQQTENNTAQRWSLSDYAQKERITIVPWLIMPMKNDINQDGHSDKLQDQESQIPGLQGQDSKEIYAPCDNESTSKGCVGQYIKNSSNTRAIPNVAQMLSKMGLLVDNDDEDSEGESLGESATSSSSDQLVCSVRVQVTAAASAKGRRARGSQKSPSCMNSQQEQQKDSQFKTAQEEIGKSNQHSHCCNQSKLNLLNEPQNSLLLPQASSHSSSPVSTVWWNSCKKEAQICGQLVLKEGAGERLMLFQETRGSATPSCNGTGRNFTMDLSFSKYSRFSSQQGKPKGEYCYSVTLWARSPPIEQSKMIKVQIIFRTFDDLMQWEQKVRTFVIQDNIWQQYIFQKLVGEGASGKVFLASKRQNSQNTHSVPANQALEEEISQQSSSHSNHETQKCYNHGKRGMKSKNAQKLSISKDKIAIKILDKAKLGTHESQITNLIHEIKVHWALFDCEGILRLIELFEDEEFVFLILEYQEEGSLLNEILKSRKFDEMNVKTIMEQLLLTIDFIHQKQIAHRDIKLDNILIHKIEEGRDYQVKIADFGIADFVNPPPSIQLLAPAQDLNNKKCHENPQKANNIGQREEEVAILQQAHESQQPGNQCGKLKQMCGTPGYVAPEILRGEPYTQICDIFSLGCVFFNLLTGMYLFSSNQLDDLIRLNKACDLSALYLSISQFSGNCQEILRSMLNPDQDKRPTAAQVLKHAWFHEDQEVLENLLSSNYHNVRKSLARLPSQAEKRSKTPNCQAKASLEPSCMHESIKKNPSLIKSYTLIKQQHQLNELRATNSKASMMKLENPPSKMKLTNRSRKGSSSKTKPAGRPFNISSSGKSDNHQMIVIEGSSCGEESKNSKGAEIQNQKNQHWYPISPDDALADPCASKLLIDNSQVNQTGANFRTQAIATSSKAFCMSQKDRRSNHSSQYKLSYFNALRKSRCDQRDKSFSGIGGLMAKNICSNGVSGGVSHLADDSDISIKLVDFTGMVSCGASLPKAACEQFMQQQQTDVNRATSKKREHVLNGQASKKQTLPLCQKAHNQSSRKRYLPKIRNKLSQRPEESSICGTPENQGSRQYLNLPNSRNRIENKKKSSSLNAAMIAQQLLIEGSSVEYSVARFDQVEVERQHEKHSEKSSSGRIGLKIGKSKKAVQLNSHIVVDCDDMSSVSLNTLDFQNTETGRVGQGHTAVRTLREFECKPTISDRFHSRELMVNKSLLDYSSGGERSSYLLMLQQCQQRLVADSIAKLQFTNQAQRDQILKMKIDLLKNSEEVPEQQFPLFIQEEAKEDDSKQLNDQLKQKQPEENQIDSSDFCRRDIQSVTMQRNQRVAKNPFKNQMSMGIQNALIPRSALNGGQPDEENEEDKQYFGLPQNSVAASGAFGLISFFPRNDGQRNFSNNGGGTSQQPPSNYESIANAEQQLNHQSPGNNQGQSPPKHGVRPTNRVLASRFGVRNSNFTFQNADSDHMSMQVNEYQAIANQNEENSQAILVNAVEFDSNGAEEAKAGVNIPKQSLKLMAVNKDLHQTREIPSSKTMSRINNPQRSHRAFVSLEEQKIQQTGGGGKQVK